MPSIIAGIWTLFQPEEISWRIEGAKGLTSTGPGRGYRGISLKAVFWCVVAILIALALGNLT